MSTVPSLDNVGTGRERLALLRENPPSWLGLWWYCFCNELVHLLKFPVKDTGVRYPGFLFITFSLCWLGSLSRYSDLLQAGRSGDRIPVGARFYAPVQTGPGVHLASCTMGMGFFPQG